METLVSVAIFVVASVVSFLVGKLGWGQKMSKVYALALSLIQGLADGKLTADEARVIAQNIMVFFTKS